MHTFMRLLAGLVCALMGTVLGISLHDAFADGPNGLTPGWVMNTAVVIFLAAIALGAFALVRGFNPGEKHVSDETPST